MNWSSVDRLSPFPPRLRPAARSRSQASCCSSQLTSSGKFMTGVQIVIKNVKFPQFHLLCFLLDQGPIAVVSYFIRSGGKKSPCSIGTIANHRAMVPIPTVKANVIPDQSYLLFACCISPYRARRRHSVVFPEHSAGCDIVGARSETGHVQFDQDQDGVRDRKSYGVGGTRSQTRHWLTLGESRRFGRLQQG